MPRTIFHCLIGFIFFCIGYLLINQHILVQAILYRAAANDYHSASIAFAAMALQATVLLTGLIVLSNRLFWMVLILTGLSAAINVIFGQILHDTIDLVILRSSTGCSRKQGMPAMRRGNLSPLSQRAW